MALGETLFWDLLRDILCCGKGYASDIKVYGDECNGMDVGDQLGFGCTVLHTAPQGASPSLPPQSSRQSQSPGVYLSRKSCAQINLSRLAKITKPWPRGAKPVVTEITLVFIASPTVYFSTSRILPWSKILKCFFAPYSP